MVRNGNGSHAMNETDDVKAAGRALLSDSGERDRLVSDLKTLVSDAEALMRQAKSVSGEAAHVAKGELELQIDRLRSRLGDARVNVSDRAHDYMGRTEAYVHREPWRALGIAVAAGVLIGITMSRR